MWLMGSCFISSKTFAQSLYWFNLYFSFITELKQAEKMMDNLTWKIPSLSIDWRDIYCAISIFIYVYTMHQIKFYVYESCVKYFILAIWSQGNLSENLSSVPFSCCTGQHNWERGSFDWDWINRGPVSQMVWHAKDPSLPKTVDFKHRPKESWRIRWRYGRNVGI